MECPNCHADTPAGETFCSNCGAYHTPTVAQVPIAIGTGATSRKSAASSAVERTIDIRSSSTAREPLSRQIFVHL